MTQSIRRVGGAFARTLHSDRAYRFETLMKLDLRSTYYVPDRICNDFTIQRTASSAALMDSIGLLYKHSGGSLSVLLDLNREAEFVDYLRSQAELFTTGRGSATPDPWTRLSFLLTVSNPEFVNITQMPLDVRPAYKAFYLSNIRAKATIPDGGNLLPGPLDRGLQVPTTGSQYSLKIVSHDVVQVRVRDLGGTVAAAVPPSVPKQVYPPLWPVAAVDFSALPEGKYTLEQYTSPDSQSPVASTEVLYVYTTPSPLFFIDLLFSKPKTVRTGVYPVTNLFPKKGQETTVTGIEYLLQFHARSTKWNYYIVSTGAPLSELQIESLSPSSPPITFSGPTLVPLPNRQVAYLFVSDEVIQLQDQSTYWFRLLGKAGSLKTRNGVLMNRLPVASGAQVIPGKSDFATTTSGSSLLTRSGAHSHDASGQKPFDYSDIYVYV